MNRDPKVSIIIPCYNQSKFSYESVVSAKHAYSGLKEIIIVNDGSTDRTTARRLGHIRETLSDDHSEIRVINQANSGAAVARNTGLERSTGAYVQFLDCDDLLIKGKIDLQIRHFQVVDGLDVSITGCLYANVHLDRFATHENLIADFDFSVEDFCLSWERGFSIPIHTALFSKPLLDRHRFDTSGSLKSKEDWEFWTRIAYHNSKIAYLRTRGAVYRVHESSICRAMPRQGDYWIKAASKINTMVGTRVPNFLEKSEEWRLANYDNLSIPSAEQIDPYSVSTITLDKIPSSKLYPPITNSENRRARLTVIVPVYNHYEHLAECFQSIFDQSVADMEMLLIDDRSTDPRVRQLLDSIPKSENVRVIYNSSNDGISTTQNRAVDHARGEFLAFVDCDDFLNPNALSKAMAFIDQSGGCDYFFSDHSEVSPGGSFIRLVHYGGYADDRFTGDLRQDLVNGMVASHLKIIRKDSLLRAGRFDPNFSGVQDWEVALRILEFGKFIYLPEPLYSRRTHPATVTSSDMRGQIHLTNIVRRLYAERFLAPKRCSLIKSSIIDSSESLKLLEVLECWKVNRLTIDTRKLLSMENLWWLREFNSYFDEILWDSPEIYAALVGYIWSPDILKRAQRCSTSPSNSAET